MLAIVPKVSHFFSFPDRAEDYNTDLASRWRTGGYPPFWCIRVVNTQRLFASLARDIVDGGYNI